MYGYDRLLEMVDAHIKLVIDELEAQDLLEDTLIIYTSDHGDGHAAHQWNQKMTFYEEAINVPFIISWKGKTKAGYLDEETLSSTGLDIFPTILSFAGVPIPGSLHGLDLGPQVLADPAGATLTDRHYVVSEINQARYKGRMVVTSDYKYNSLRRWRESRGAVRSRRGSRRTQPCHVSTGVSRATTGSPKHAGGMA